MTVAEHYHNKPFEMMNLHRLWCGFQKKSEFCNRRVGLIERKYGWNECPFRQVCFTAYINSDYDVVGESK